MAKITFHVFISGDTSVGIPDGEATVTVDEVGIPEPFDPEEIANWKQTLADHYDCGGTKSVMTEEEFQAYTKEQDELERKMMETEARESVGLTEMSRPDSEQPNQRSNT